MVIIVPTRVVNIGEHQPVLDRSNPSQNAGEALVGVLGGHVPGPGLKRLDEGLLVGLTAVPKAYLDQERGTQIVQNETTQTCLAGLAQANL